ncbi:hypothetical protein [Kribbella sp. NBC_00889]|uniref:hypothetical protein n=1 Tax=Kribbella sp. NBC_00889 TaxID=2975974 RepID=UPI00386EA34C|nr:hypothetical protein OG817_27065 [Kribbella sp. NBC_00889]
MPDGEESEADYADRTREDQLPALPSYFAGHVSRISHRTLVDALADQGRRLPHCAVLAGLGPLW